jgi:hypothetical protein
LVLGYKVSPLSDHHIGSIGSGAEMRWMHSEYHVPLCISN